MSHWATKYLGMKYDHDEFNCADFVAHVLENEFNHKIELPRASKHMREYSRQIITKMTDFVEPTPIEKPEENCLVLMKSRGLIAHVGIYVSEGMPSPKVFHCMKDFGSSLMHDIHFLDCIGLNVIGYYKWLKTK
jgi:hypothetical protein